jgi:hypothetical protein
LLMMRQKLVPSHSKCHFSLSAFESGWPLTFYGMMSCGIMRRFPISLHRLFLRATNPRNPLKPACTIPCVVCRLFFIFHYFRNLFRIYVSLLL